MERRSVFERLRRGYVGAAILWTNLCLLLLALNGVAALYLRARDRAYEAPARDLVEKSMARIYDDWSPDELEQLRDESRHHFVPDGLIQFREAASSGRFVNIDPYGFRVGKDQGPWPPDPESYNIFLFGGSTALGYGVEDDETISSHLQSILEREAWSRPPRLYNFARGSFYSTQERLLFDRLVTLGARPDAVVFLDGLNDFFFPRDPPPLTAFWTQRGNEMLRRPSWSALQDLSLLRALSPAGPHALAQVAAATSVPKAPPRNDADAADGVIRRYRSNLAISESLAAAHGIRALFVWQPVPTYGYDLRHHAFGGDFGRHELARTGYPRFREQLEEEPIGSGFLWCAEIQRDASELLYVDAVHYSPEMSRRVAECIAELALERELLP